MYEIFTQKFVNHRLLCGNNTKEPRSGLFESSYSRKILYEETVMLGFCTLRYPPGAAVGSGPAPTIFLKISTTSGSRGIYLITFS
jgi:hypothetical protein